MKGQGNAGSIEQAMYHGTVWTGVQTAAMRSPENKGLSAILSRLAFVTAEADPARLFGG